MGRFDKRRVRSGARNRKVRRGLDGAAVPAARRIHAPLVVGVLVLAIGAGAADAAAQQHASSTSTRAPVASPLLEADHWAVEALRRLEGLGAVAPVYAHGGPSPRAEEALRLFRAAAESAGPVVARIAGAYAARLDEELAPVTTSADHGRGPLRGRVVGVTGVAFVDRSGDVLAGIGYDNETDWTGTRPVADRRGTALAIGWSALLHPSLAVESVMDWGEDGLEVRHGQVVLVGKGVGLWAGRRSVDYGGGSGGGVVLSNSSFDGGGLFLPAPLRLPGVLARLGPIRFETFFTGIENGDRINDPWFWATRGVLEPHPRLSLGATRGIQFGGEGNTSMTARTFAYMLIGKHSGDQGEYDNQVVSFDARYRPPVGSLPLLLFLEWGMDDSAGAWRDVPAFVVGADIAAVPGLPAVAVGLERARIAESCCGNPMWYRNWALRGGWTDGGRPIGHPLAGHGDEWSGRVRVELAEARVQIEARGFVRERGEENLFAPERVGRSRGAAFGLRARTPSNVELVARGFVEDGRGDWRRSSLDAGLLMRF